MVDDGSGPCERLLDVSVVARRLNVTAATVRTWIHKGKIRVVLTPTGRFRVPFSALVEILATQKTPLSKGVRPTATLRPHP